MRVLRPRLFLSRSSLATRIVSSSLQNGSEKVRTSSLQIFRSLISLNTSCLHPISSLSTSIAPFRQKQKKIVGFLGRTANSTSTLNTINEDSVTESWITPMDTCSLWQYAYGNNATVAWGTHYLPLIATRLNKLFSATLPRPGLSLTTADVHGALYACAYDYAAWKSSPWCAVFEEQEILDFEYELDLLMQGAFG